MDDRLSGITPFLPPAIQKQLEALSAGQRRQVTELRLRAGQPLALTLAGETVFLAPWASKSPAGAAAVTNEQLQQTLLLCCGRSLHSCADSLRQGFVTLPGGHRVGVAGTARTEAGQVLSVHSITSLNIRVAGVVPDAGDILLQRFYAVGLAGALIAGPPLSGKTTVLKSIIRKLSGGWRTRRACRLRRHYGRYPRQLSQSGGYRTGAAVAVARADLLRRIKRRRNRRAPLRHERRRAAFVHRPRRG